MDLHVLVDYSTVPLLLRDGSRVVCTIKDLADQTARKCLLDRD